MVAIEHELIGKCASFHERLVEKGFAGIFDGGDFCWARALEAAEFEGVVVGGEDGGFVETFPIGGQVGRLEIGEFAVPWLLEG